jgi:xanthine/CO dehydrogenase XdhC/CoxF family maturation factor
LEDDLIKKAWWLTEQGPTIRRYDTTAEGEVVAEYGLGCNGIIFVRLERIEPGRASVLDQIRRVRDTRTPIVVEHVISPTEVFAETLTPPIRLLVFGAGEDVIPLVSLSKSLGWQVVVFDGRAHYARREKFPEADQVIVRAPGCGNPPIEVDLWTAAVLMSHSYKQDLQMLKELAERALPYVGLLGPRKRALKILRDAGLEAFLANGPLYTPIGLDIGADGPEQVALSVVAEIQATFNGRTGNLLRDRAGSIHADEIAEGALIQSTIYA